LLLLVHLLHAIAPEISRAGTIPTTPVSTTGMDVNWLNSLLAAPLVCLFMIPFLWSFAVSQPHSVGIRVPIVQLPPQPQPAYECNAISLTVWLTKDGRIWINNTETPAKELTERLAEIFEYRMHPVLYVFADHQVSYGQFLDYMARIMVVRAIRPRLRIVLVSGQLREEVEHYQTFQGYCTIGNPEEQHFVRPAMIRP
jgi:biopolymer transport protein ExbD